MGLPTPTTPPPPLPRASWGSAIHVFLVNHYQMSRLLISKRSWNVLFENLTVHINKVWLVYPTQIVTDITAVFSSIWWYQVLQNQHIWLPIQVQQATSSLIKQFSVLVPCNLGGGVSIGGTVKFYWTESERYGYQLLLKLALRNREPWSRWKKTKSEHWSLFSLYPEWKENKLRNFLPRRRFGNGI